MGFYFPTEYGDWSWAQLLAILASYLAVVGSIFAYFLLKDRPSSQRPASGIGVGGRDRNRLTTRNEKASLKYEGGPASRRQAYVGATKP